MINTLYLTPSSHLSQILIVASQINGLLQNCDDSHAFIRATDDITTETLGKASD